MICSSCGATVADGTAFCGSCGRPVIGYNVGQSAPVVQSAGMAVPVGGVAPPGAAFYAGFWLRFVAYLIDAGLTLVVLGVIAAIFFAIVGVGVFRNLAQEGNGSNPAFPVAILGIIWFFSIVLIVASWLYFALMESSPRQGTLGKIAMSLAVTDMQGRPVTFGRASGRFFGKIVTGMIPLAIGYIMAGFTEKKQALHDMIASCLVVRKT
ncbi:MAG TPA: RDD family protein [Candidatus Baltobacteraceae bacterium]|nr:RDD family protein [Candidatus Baltobacteraceae bacterium]